MNEFSPFSCSVIKRLLSDRKGSVIVQKGPKLFSLDSIFANQDFRISVKKINLERRPGSVINPSSRLRAKNNLKSKEFIKTSKEKSSFFRPCHANKYLCKELDPLPDEKVTQNIRLRSSSLL